MITNNKSVVSYDSILKQASQNKVSIYSFSKTYISYIILFLGIILSILAYYFVKEYVYNDSKLNFERATNSVISRLDNRLKSEMSLMNSMLGLYENYKNNVPWHVFDLYSSIPAKSAKSVISLSYAPKITKEKLNDFLIVAMGQIWTYKIYPEGQRDFYYPIYYIAPYEKNNQYKTGYDLSVDKSLQPSLETAFNTGKIIATPIYELRSPDTVGFVLITPVFDTLYYNDKNQNKNISENKYEVVGTIILEIDSKKFFESALLPQVPSDTSIVFELLFPDKNNKDKKVFSSANINLLQEDYDGLVQIYNLKIADKDLKIKFKTIPNFGGTFKSTLPVIAVIVSGILTLTLFGLFISINTSRARALDLADRMTRSQRRIVDSSKDIIAVLGLDGIWKSMNPASIAVLNYEPNEMIGLNLQEFLINTNDFDSFLNIIKQATDEQTQRVDFKMKTSNNQFKWVNWSFTVSKTDSLIYCIGRDVTLEKINEEQELLRRKQIQLAEQLAREASESKSIFMTKLSHHLRNSLTSIIGYLQLLSTNSYEDQQELEFFIKEAENGSEELFTYVSDLVEVALADIDGSFNSLTNIKIDTLFKEINKRITKLLPKEKKIQINISDESKLINVLADKRLLDIALFELLNGLTQGELNNVISVQAFENQYEAAIEIQIETNPNPIVSELITIFKNNSNNIIEALSNDINDVLLHFAIASSTFRMMSGSLNLETFGAKDSNIVQISLPLNQNLTN